jgi:hypothetical protein
MAAMAMAFMGKAWAWWGAGQVREVALAWRLPWCLFLQGFKGCWRRPKTEPLLMGVPI